TTHERLRGYVRDIRAIETRHGRPISILADLQGPKLRLGTFAHGRADLAAGATFVFDDDPKPGDFARVHLAHPEILSDLKAGHRLLIDDGKVRLVVTDASPNRVVTKVEIAGRVSDRKGVSLPDTIVPVSALTPKDHADLDAALDASVDWVALSFIQRPEDVAEGKKIV